MPTRDEWIAIGAAALKAEDKRRRDADPALELRPYSDTSDRYEVAATLVYDAFVAESLKNGEVI